ncbi:SGNH/GDSL hydrolase family protein [Croceitalea sp. MTPC9]|uniref:GDSL-type esterase/lipase family protein n=1 Tax=unclassified Croceitalea TaxID=2632280 RepID=UPI002B3C6D90|nr:SGNH/GDSL hydrolase family protein [Croceitalea sp. MTPC6]GMN16150.1 SGNH/GDSL hydrolase family protein [Croceitalea sp. MTPC9]
MKKSIFYIIIGVLILLNILLLTNPCLVSKCTTPQQRKATNKRYYAGRNDLFKILPQSNSDILFLGNSITDGAELQELFNNPNVKNRGINADTIIGLQERLEEILGIEPNKIFILIGTNDLKNHTVSKILIDYKNLLEKIRILCPTSQLYVQSILPVKNSTLRNNEDINTINASLKKILAGKANIKFIDVNSPLRGLDGELKSSYTYDGLHLNGAGYMKWKTVIEKFVSG